jgi:hypothetical protein
MKSQRDLERSHAIREWLKFMAETDFSESECRDALADVASIIPQHWIEHLHRKLHGKAFSVAEWTNCKASLAPVKQ